MTSKNTHLHRVKKSPADEYYTQFWDIAKGMRIYNDMEYFKGKTVYCNADNYEHSQFVKYFSTNFKELQLKALFATSFARTDLFQTEYGTYYHKTEDDTTKGKLKYNGDFRSNECIEILKQSDVVVTNPPFSLFKYLLDICYRNKKHFILIGHMTGMSNLVAVRRYCMNELFVTAYFKGDHMQFILPNGDKRSINVAWYSNIPGSDNWIPEINLRCSYSEDPKLYKTFDTDDKVLEVPKLRLIPKDYYGYMAVPITFVKVHNRKQFKVVAFDRLNMNQKTFATVDGNKIFRRIIIKRVK